MSGEWKPMADRKFHAHDGIEFSRMWDGWVSVEQAGEMLFNFDPATWASIVAFVSAGNNGERYRSALSFHQGREQLPHAQRLDVNDVHAIEINLSAALEKAASHFEFMAQMAEVAGGPEAPGNAAINRRWAAECLKPIRNHKPSPPAHSPSDEDKGQ